MDGTPFLDESETDRSGPGLHQGLFCANARHKGHVGRRQVLSLSEGVTTLGASVTAEAECAES